MNGYGEENRGQIVEVWAHNLEEEIGRIRDVVERYQYIALDTEFPGIVARPTSTASDYNYRTVKYNVDLLKVIQLGVTFADSKGFLAKGTSTWQFNFRFDLDQDMYAQNSIDFLKLSGIDFDKQQKKGVEVHDFGELIMNSGLVMNEDVKWISFHGCYDFGYLVKLLTCEALPDSETAFFELLHDFFPSLYDIKYLLREIPTFNLSGGASLQKVSEQLAVTRVGPQHQAGSDSLVTCHTFFKLVEAYFDNKIDEQRFSGIIYGLGMTPTCRPPAPMSGVSVHSSPSLESSALIQSISDLHSSLPSVHDSDNGNAPIGAHFNSSGTSNIGVLGGSGGSTSCNRHLSVGAVRCGSGSQPQQHSHGCGVVWGSSSCSVPMRHHPQGLLGMPTPLSESASCVVGSDSSSGRVRGILPHVGGVSGSNHRGSGSSEMHRTGSAPPAPLLCGGSKGRLWTASGLTTDAGSSTGGGVGMVNRSAHTHEGEVNLSGEIAEFLFDNGAQGLHTETPPPPPGV